MSFLLDTNVLAELRKPRPHAPVAAWYEGVGDEELFLSVLVVGEIQQGVTRLRRKDPRQAAVYEAWLGRLRREFADRVLPVSQDVALAWGPLAPRQRRRGGSLVLGGLLERRRRPEPGRRGRRLQLAGGAPQAHGDPLDQTEPGLRVGGTLVD